MFKKLFTTITALCFALLSVKADEGMWLPLLLQDNETDMQNLGLQLTSQDIYDINNSSLKDAGKKSKSKIIKLNLAPIEDEKEEIQGAIHGALVLANPSPP